MCYKCYQIPPHLTCHMWIYKKDGVCLTLSVPLSLGIAGRDLRILRRGWRMWGMYEPLQRDSWKSCFLFRCLCTCTIDCSKQCCSAKQIHACSSRVVRYLDASPAICCLLNAWMESPVSTLQTSDMEIFQDEVTPITWVVQKHPLKISEGFSLATVIRATILKRCL